MDLMGELVGHQGKIVALELFRKGKHDPLPLAKPDEDMMIPHPLEQLNRNGFSNFEQQRIDGIYADLSVTEAANRRNQIAIAGNHLREFEGLSRFTFNAIGCLVGLKDSAIKGQWKSPNSQHGSQVECCCSPLRCEHGYLVLLPGNSEIRS
jgi:hypothetical protein